MFAPTPATTVRLWPPTVAVCRLSDAYTNWNARLSNETLGSVAHPATVWSPEGLAAKARRSSPRAQRPLPHPSVRHCSIRGWSVCSALRSRPMTSGQEAPGTQDPFGSPPGHNVVLAQFQGYVLHSYLTGTRETASLSEDVPGRRQTGYPWVRARPSGAVCVVHDRNIKSSGGPPGV